MQSKISKYLSPLILPSDDPGEKLKNKICKECNNTKTILEIEDLQVLSSRPCPHCAPTPEDFRQSGLL